MTPGKKVGTFQVELATLRTPPFTRVAQPLWATVTADSADAALAGARSPEPGLVTVTSSLVVELWLQTMKAGSRTFCESIRKARVTARIEGTEARFEAVSNQRQTPTEGPCPMPPPAP